jgi:hypothetical protein
MTNFGVLPAELLYCYRCSLLSMPPIYYLRLMHFAFNFLPNWTAVLSMLRNIYIGGTAVHNTNFG